MPIAGNCTNSPSSRNFLGIAAVERMTEAECFVTAAPEFGYDYRGDNKGEKNRDGSNTTTPKGALARGKIEA